MIFVKKIWKISKLGNIFIPSFFFFGGGVRQGEGLVAHVIATSATSLRYSGVGDEFFCHS